MNPRRAAPLTLLFFHSLGSRRGATIKLSGTSGNVPLGFRWASEIHVCSCDLEARCYSALSVGFTRLRGSVFVDGPGIGNPEMEFVCAM